MPSKNLDRVLSHEQVLNDFRNTHGDRYDYSKMLYHKSSEKVEIICREHGSFWQSPTSHKKGYNCYMCGIAERTKKITTSNEVYINRANKKHNFKYNYDKTNYLNSFTIIEVTCKKHGDFNIMPKNHLNGFGCNSCSVTGKSNTKDYLEKVNKVHGNKYDYSLVDYTISTEKIKIICKEHGIFEQRANAHLKGDCCPKCSSIHKGYSRSEYVAQANGKLSTLYLIRCWNEEEEFYKIGITINSVNKRYCSKESMPYFYEVIKDIKGEAGKIYDKEKSLLRQFKKFKYKPIISFKGYTECIKTEELEIIKAINNARF